MTLIQRLPEPPNLGTRDIALLRTLVAIAFKWALERPTELVVEHAIAISKQPKSETHLPSSISEVPSDSSITEAQDTLLNSTNRMLHLVFESSEVTIAPVYQSHITRIILTRHVTALLRACIVLACAANNKADVMKSEVDRLLKM
jgi:hypothetical protein